VALNFPNSPIDGQSYEGFIWNESVGAWQRADLLFQLNELTDVAAPSPVTGDLLYYNGEQWVNAAPEDINIGTSDENLSALFWMYA
jgi:hypothetical protein